MGAPPPSVLTARRMSPRSSRASAGYSTSSVRPGRVGLSPIPLRSTRRQGTPSAAHLRASSTQSRAGPWCPIRPGLRRTTVGTDGSTRPSGSLRMPKSPRGPSSTVRSTTPAGPFGRWASVGRLLRRRHADRRPAGFGQPSTMRVQRRLRCDGGDVEESVLPVDPHHVDVGQRRLPLLQRAVELPLLSGQHQLTGGPAPVARTDPQWLERRDGLRGEHDTRSLRRPVRGPGPRAPDLTLAEKPPLGGLVA